MRKGGIFVIALALMLTGCNPHSTEELEQSQKQSDRSEETESDTALRPGTLPDPDEITQPDQSAVGTVETFTIAEKNDQTFTYYFNASTKAERLVLIEFPMDMEETSVELLVLDTTFGGWDGLKDALDKPFDAKILAHKNISCEEGMYAHNATLPGSGMADKYHEGEIVDFNNIVNQTGDVQIYMGSIYHSLPSNTQDAIMNELPSGKFVSILSNIGSTESPQIAGKRAVFEKIYKRFGITEEVSVESR